MLPNCYQKSDKQLKKNSPKFIIKKIVSKKKKKPKKKKREYEQHTPDACPVN